MFDPLRGGPLEVVPMLSGICKDLSVLLYLETAVFAVINARTFSMCFSEIIEIQEVTRLRASPRHGGSGRFQNFWLLTRRGGVPSGAAAFIISGNREMRIRYISPRI